MRDERVSRVNGNIDLTAFCGCDILVWLTAIAFKHSDLQGNLVGFDSIEIGELQHRLNCIVDGLCEFEPVRNLFGRHN